MFIAVLLQLVQFSHCKVVSNSLWPHGLRHARLPCPSSSSRVCSNSCPLSWWCHPTISSSDAPFFSCPQLFPASGVFYNESVLHIRWPKVFSFSFSISPSNEYSGMISFRMDWLDLLAVQGTHTSKAPIFRCSAFFMVPPSHHCMTSGETIALTRWTFVGKVMSLLFNMLSRLVITFLPRSKCLNFMAAVIICSDFRAQKIKSVTVFSPICHEVIDGPDAMIFIFWMLSFKSTFSFSSSHFPQEAV